MEPASGITNYPTLGYNIECTATRLNTDILYKASAEVDNATTYIVMPIDGFLSNSLSVYNCCVEVVYETYSSIACTLERLTSFHINVP